MVLVEAGDPDASRITGDSGRFLVSRNGSRTQPLSVSYALGGTAENGLDYAALPGTVTIPADQSEVNVVVTPVLTSPPEPHRTVTLTLLPSAGYTLGTPSTAKITFIGENADNQAPVVSAGSSQTVRADVAADLKGEVRDDGMPNPPGQTTSKWEKLSGPGSVSFGNASELKTTASFSSPGIYVLRLTADDSSLSSTDDVTITVQSANQPPTVHAGPGQTIDLPASAALSGSAADDGLPTLPGSLSFTWSKASGPGQVVFGKTDALITSASFSQAGTYVLRLTANDGDLSSASEVTLEVNPANQAPTVVAGADQVIQSHRERLTERYRSRRRLAQAARGFDDGVDPGQRSRRGLLWQRRGAGHQRQLLRGRRVCAAFDGKRRQPECQRRACRSPSTRRTRPRSSVPGPIRRSVCRPAQRSRVRPRTTVGHNLPVR